MAKNTNKNLSRPNPDPQNQSSQIPRPPVVVIVGHVDHGKTSLLDYIRKTKIASREAGGITQHVSADEIKHNGKLITFLDTPGHEAFSLMRERGTKVADLAVLVIAAEEGLKPQTKEALSFIQQAKIPYVIALNKTDLPEANPDKVKQQLAELEVYVEDWGGKIPCFPVSAKTGRGVDELLEIILLMAEMEELKADPKAEPRGVVIESSINPQTGFTATVLVLDGTLSVGQTLYTQTAEIMVKGMENFLGERVKSLTFSSPAIIAGWDKQPRVGETFSTQPFPAENESKADENPEPLDKIPETPAKDNKTFALVLKADVAGSLEALEAVICQLFEEMKIKAVIRDKSVGPMTLTNIKTIEQSGSIIVSFRSKISPELKNYVQDHGLKLFESNIIYELKEKLKTYLEEILKPDAEKLTGKLEVLKVFSEKDKKNRQVIGGRLFEGKARKNQKFNLKKGEETAGEGKVLSIKKNKQEMESAEAVNEIGLQIETLSEIGQGDLLEFRVQ